MNWEKSLTIEDTVLLVMNIRCGTSISTMWKDFEVVNANQIEILEHKIKTHIAIAQKLEDKVSYYDKKLQQVDTNLGSAIHKLESAGLANSAFGKWMHGSMTALVEKNQQKELIDLQEIRNAEPERDLSSFYSDVVSLYSSLLKDASSAIHNEPNSILKVGEPVYLDFGELDVHKTTYTKYSIAEWFYEYHSPELAQIICPNTRPKSKGDNLHLKDLIEKNEKLIEENKRLKEVEHNRASITNDSNNYPSGIKKAIHVFSECWSHLPEDMQRPGKENLIGFIKSKLEETEISTIEALLKLSTPDNDRYGGKAKKEHIKPWRPKDLN